MNTLNNKIGITANKRRPEDIMDDAVKAGYPMVLIDGHVYSVEHFKQTDQGVGHFLLNYPLFHQDDLNPPAQSPGMAVVSNEEPIIKFNKSFEALYNIAMKMADECIGAKDLKSRFKKLDEEYNELSDAFEAFTQLVPTHVSETTEYYDPHELREVWNNIVGEAADVLFVLLHILHRSGEATAFELLHKASSKMLSRMNDVNYIAKN